MTNANGNQWLDERQSVLDCAKRMFAEGLVVGVRQRVDEHALRRREHGGRGPDAESQGEDGGRGEAWLAPEHADRVTQIGERGDEARASPAEVPVPVWRPIIGLEGYGLKIIEQRHLPARRVP